MGGREINHPYPSKCVKSDSFFYFSFRYGISIIWAIFEFVWILRNASFKGPSALENVTVQAQKNFSKKLEDM